MSYCYWFILILWMHSRNLWYHVKFCIFIKSHHLAQTPIPTVCSSECRFPSLTLFKTFQNILESVQTALNPNSVLCQRWLGAPDRSSDLIWSFRPDGVELWERSEVAVMDGASLQASAGGKGLPRSGWERFMFHERGRLPTAFATVQWNVTRTSGYMEIRWNILISMHVLSQRWSTACKELCEYRVVKIQNAKIHSLSICLCEFELNCPHRKLNWNLNGRKWNFLHYNIETQYSDSVVTVN